MTRSCSSGLTWPMVTVAMILAATTVTSAHAAAMLPAVFLFAPPYSVVQVQERDAILECLAHIGLDDGALIALNLSEAQAEAVVASARTWHEAQAERVRADQADVATQRHAWQEAQKAVRQGSNLDNGHREVAAALEALQLAEAHRRDRLSELESSIASQLSESQRSAWLSLTVERGRCTWMRLMAWSTEQSELLTVARQSRRESLTARTASETRRSAQQGWESSVQSILTQDQAQMAAAYERFVKSSTSNVARAVALVLPVGNG